MQLQQRPPVRRKPIKPKQQNKFLGWFIVALAFFWSFAGQRLKEDLQLLFYAAPPNVAQLATEAGMSAKGRRIFYLTKPLVSSENLACRHNTSEKTIVLGCYSISKNLIAIQNVTDPRISGIMQVTAAHEMLHAVYQQMSVSERQQIDRELAAVFSTLTDDRIKRKIELYREEDPSVVPDELHSILGTEIDNLPPALERHYQQYFADRSAVVRFNKLSAQPFDQIYNQADEIKWQLKTMAKEIERLKGLPPNPEVNAVLSTQIDVYNATVDRYNSLVQKNRSLNRSLAGEP